MGLTQSKIDTKVNDNMESDDECFHDAEAGITQEEIDDFYMMNYVLYYKTDAVESKRVNIFNPKITYETMREIERELDFYEKVSLVFLIFDQEDIALQSLLIEKENLVQHSTINLFVEWARSDTLWTKKIIEGLCIIQNYSILNRLGYDKEELKLSHLPSSPYTANNLNILNKALYRFAESLTIDQIREFLRLLEKDFRAAGLNFLTFDDTYLEMYLLQCFSVKYINKNDISNLIAILKKMKLYEQIEMLDTAFRMKNNTICETDDDNMKPNLSNIGKTNTICNFDLNSKFHNNAKNTAVCGSCSDHSVITRSSLVKTYPSEEIYKIDPDNVGICLIINQYKFYVDTNTDNPLSGFAPEHPLEDRNGTEFDRDSLKETFTKYNFRIITHENLTNVQIENVIRNTLSSFNKKDSCFIVCILSHGEEDTVFGVNSIPVFISEIEGMLYDTQYTALLGKPKILIVQSCQGKKLQKVLRVDCNYVTDGLTEPPPPKSNKIYFEGPEVVPPIRDLLVLTSTVPGFASIRDPANGTWFIQEFCNTFEERSDETHVEDIMTIVIGKVSSKIWPKEKELVTMVPQKKTTFSKKLFLFKNQK